jgi:DNA-3-methyladenine glycosylase II
MMRGCGFPDCVPVGDTGLTEALRVFHGMETRPNAQQTLELMAPFRPWRSLATAHLWRSLGDATGEG